MKLEDYLVYNDTFSKVKSVLGEYKNDEIRVAYSAGSDSDTMMWLLRYMDYNIKAIIYDTGLEYQATWKHVDYMRSEGFDIEIVKPSKSIPNTVHHYGAPFISKYVSDMIQRLQYNKFDFKNDGLLSFEDAYAKYPNSKTALKWWTSTNVSRSININWNRALKEFLIENNGIPFTPSGHCCYTTKKLPSIVYSKANGTKLLMLGIRQTEGGKRATAHRSCYVKEKIYPHAMFFPLFWWRNEDKDLFTEIMGIKHSECYTKYGMRRTGCPACPFGRKFEEEIVSIAEFEPKLSKAIENLFGESYEWTRKYRKFQEENKIPGYYSKDVADKRRIEREKIGLK
jgi:3'-phosphoadenosine 5'-phosphosulfate sulfotransferase (PAPS reductase)/FAD synthetase